MPDLDGAGLEVLDDRALDEQAADGQRADGQRAHGERSDGQGTERVRAAQGQSRARCAGYGDTGPACPGLVRLDLIRPRLVRGLVFGDVPRWGRSKIPVLVHDM